MKGTLLKLNVDGDPKNKENWLKRDIWLTGNGNLCYFSQKKGKKLVLLDHESMVRHEVAKLGAADSCMENAFILKPKTDDGSDESALAEEAMNTPFCRLQEKFHTFVLRCLRNISEAP
jgi:hypothetical protein